MRPWAQTFVGPSTLLNRRHSDGKRCKKTTNDFQRHFACEQGLSGAAVGSKNAAEHQHLVHTGDKER